MANDINGQSEMWGDVCISWVASQALEKEERRLKAQLEEGGERKRRKLRGRKIRIKRRCGNGRECND